MQVEANQITTSNWCLCYATHSCFTAFQNLYMYTSLTPHQRTPLHYAAQGGFVDTVRYLVGAGGDINIKDGFGVSE